MWRAARALGESWGRWPALYGHGPLPLCPKPGARARTFSAGQRLPSNLPSQSSYDADNSPPSPSPSPPPTFHPSLGLLPLGQSVPDPASSLPHLHGVSPWPWPHPTRFCQLPSLSAPPSTSTPLAQCQSQIHPFRALSGPPPHYASPSQLLSPPSFSPSPLLVLPTPAGAEMRAAQGRLASPQHPDTVLVGEVPGPPWDIRQWRKVRWGTGRAGGWRVSGEDVSWLQGQHLRSLLPPPQSCPIQASIL